MDHVDKVGPVIADALGGCREWGKSGEGVSSSASVSLSVLTMRSPCYVSSLVQLRSCVGDIARYCLLCAQGLAIEGEL